MLLQNDELKIYRGEDFVVSEHIKIHQPSLSEICEYGEQEYYSMIYYLTATPQTLKVQLWDMEPRIDYTKITPYELFCNMLYKLFTKDKTSIIFGDLDLTKFQMMQRKDNGDILLYQRIEKSSDNTSNNDILSKIITKIKNILRINKNEESIVEYDEVIIDEFTYNLIIDYLRKVHNVYKDEKIPANETTKIILIEDDREEMQRNKNKEYHSQLKNLISAMINCEGFKYNHSQVWDMRINAFMDSVKRISKIKNSNLLLQSGYSGFGINLKDIDKKQLDWMGELD